jgi:hypothetical protein
MMGIIHNRLADTALLMRTIQTGQKLFSCYRHHDKRSTPGKNRGNDPNSGDYLCSKIKRPAQLPFWKSLSRDITMNSKLKI